ncbi:MAG: hypothetical protein IJQ95_06465 [Paludibacteraceae bacterium]|nr:hypothetical protein [Paludibacteraceae bacterium]
MQRELIFDILKMGIIDKVLRQQSYVVKHPRNYDKTPLTAGERKNVESFKQALTQFQLDKQDPERMAYWTARYKAQLENGDPEAPIDKETGKHRIYARLDNFIRAMLQLQFRNQ